MTQHALLTPSRPLTNVIAGEAVDAVDVESSFDIVDPCTGTTIARAPISGAADVDAAMKAASAAFPTWGGLTPAERHRALSRFGDALNDDVRELALLEVANTGKPHSWAVDVEATMLAEAVRFYSATSRMLHSLASTEYIAGHTSVLRREPIGVVTVVLPWNYPMLFAVGKVLQAIAVGNTVVVKPAEATPLTAIRLAELFNEHLPAGVVNVVLGDASTGRLLVRHDTPAAVSFTGSMRGGIEVAKDAAAKVKRVTLELGGNAPAVLFNDADIAGSIEPLIDSAYINAGQDCTAATRILVQDGLYEEFLQEFTARVASVRTGMPTEDVVYGPLVSQTQLDRFFGFIDRLPSHAEIRTGGTRQGETGYFVTPTVVTGVQQRDEIVQAEVFGPLVTVQRFSDEAEALMLANDTDYGLAASVWSADHDRVIRMSRALDFGIVFVNASHHATSYDTPHGGFKGSGYGKDLSSYTVDEFTRIKHVLSGFKA